jgi:hypothetical protein
LDEISDVPFITQPINESLEDKEWTKIIQKFT